MERIGKYAEKPEIKEVKTAEKDGNKIEGFWTTVLENSGEFSGIINKNDKEILKFLTDVRIEYDQENESNFCVQFIFAKNPYFEHEVLERKLYFVPNVAGEPEINRIECSKLEWTSEDKNPTILVKKVKVKSSKVN